MLRHGLYTDVRVLISSDAQTDLLSSPVMEVIVQSTC